MTFGPDVRQAADGGREGGMDRASSTRGTEGYRPLNKCLPRYIKILEIEKAHFNLRTQSYK